MVGNDRWIIVLPDADYRPSKRAQVCVCVSVAGSVPRELRFPPTTIACGHALVARATVPKASINEDRDVLPSKRDIDTPTREPWDRPYDPEPQATAKQLTADGELSGCVARRLPRHARGDAR